MVNSDEWINYRIWNLKTQKMFNLYKRHTYPLVVKMGKKIEETHFSKPPIIIGAAPRSGTTLLLSILDSIPTIYGIHNQSYGFTSWQKNAEGQLIPVRLDRFYRELLWRRIPSEVNRWCEKTPKNVIYFDKIFNWFGDQVKVIHLVRDGRDVVTSKHPKHRPNDYWVRIEKWVEHVSFALQLTGHPNLITIRYEDLVFEFKKEMKKLCHFLDEDTIPDQKAWIQKTSLKRSKHWHHPVENLHSKSIGRWKDQKHQARIQEFMENQEAVGLLKRFGYKV